jgi:hypothetical protein
MRPMGACREHNRSLACVPDACRGTMRDELLAGQTLGCPCRVSGQPSYLRTVMENLPDIIPHDHKVGGRFEKILRGLENLSLHRGTLNTRAPRQSLRRPFIATRLPVNLRSRVLSATCNPPRDGRCFLGPKRVYPTHLFTITNNLSTIFFTRKTSRIRTAGILLISMALECGTSARTSESMPRRRMAGTVVKPEDAIWEVVFHNQIV